MTQNRLVLCRNGRHHHGVSSTDCRCVVACGRLPARLEQRSEGNGATRREHRTGPAVAGNRAQCAQPEH
eukprot:2812695-Pleurochrysis_carterae.AAC.2